ncbi:hypothetical protein GDO81_009055 [Engystomops pustulosus]|uniref:Major facilitator superfamily (MFS) profile domain-containing protein n=1 Tax=Engystomops pustulosus TaxID=76066 RepID=A0AAV7BNA1_ENGPU|nr:hypothetical protein GDO81_009055 [Engystomops pustulosus]KAG8574121.1 hypothetical protein GDO81_009055 [Engystomops pustulosus]
MMDCGPCRWLNEKRGSREVVLVVVSVALLLDNMLFTVVVPIIPSFLYEKEHKNENTSVVRISPDPKSSFASIHSLYDNSTFLSGHSPHHGIINQTLEAPTNDSCNKETSVLQEENVQVGLLFASKAILQLLVNPIVGLITNRVGYDMPMFCGFIILFLSTIIFAFSGSYTLLFFARSLQGVGSSFSTVAGLGSWQMYTRMTMKGTPWALHWADWHWRVVVLDD